TPLRRAWPQWLQRPHVGCMAKAIARLAGGDKPCANGEVDLTENTRGTRVTQDNRLFSTRFPRASQYHPEWVLANASGGANVLWLTEWLAPALDLRPGMRVLDLGWGKASSSVFLHREFGVRGWGTDLWFGAAEILQSIGDA